MPELPEVETTINDLKPHVLGKRITGVKIYRPSIIAAPSVEEFQRALPGSTIIEIKRRGKHLIFKLDNDQFLIVHMRMTGALLIKSAADQPDKYIRVLISLEDKIAIHFRDVRCFGRMWLVREVDSVIGKLGLEPLDCEFTSRVLAGILKNRRIPIKGLLLDQSLIAGIGNMYADEALFQAKIHPLQAASTLTKSEVKHLHKAIQAVLKQGIDNKGASTETYFRPGGIKGEAHLQFKVAHQKGKACPSVCGNLIERTVVHQRGTFYCPECQKLHA